MTHRIPQLDQFVVAARQELALIRMDAEGAQFFRVTYNERSKRQLEVAAHDTVASGADQNLAALALRQGSHVAVLFRNL